MFAGGSRFFTLSLRKNHCSPRNKSIRLLCREQRNFISQFAPKLYVLGVGGAGGNAVNHMIKSGIEGINIGVVNTDAQALSQSLAPVRIQLAPHLTQGLGAGANPEMGQKSVEGENMEAVLREVEGSHLVFLVCGLGGGTGTGASPSIAKSLKEKGIPVVGVVTTPFRFEGRRRETIALEGLQRLEPEVDTLIVIPNQKLRGLAETNRKMSLLDGFKLVDDVLLKGVQTISDLIVKPSLVNVDFSDVRTILLAGGSKGNKRALMGTGEASGSDRSKQAAFLAVSNPLLNDGELAGANGLLINISGGADMKMEEIVQAADFIQEKCDEDAYVVWGATQEESLNGKIRVSVVATGLSS